MDEAKRIVLIACIRSDVSPRSIYEQIGEELFELGAKVMKYARLLSDDNPSPCSPKRVEQQIIEELSDVCLCCAVAGLHPDAELMDRKLDRWIKRLDELEGNDVTYNP